jgi:hypothetical protein
MSLADLANGNGIQCPDYEAASGSKRCIRFNPDRSCLVDSHPVCEEWLRANPTKVPENQDAAAFVSAHPRYVKAVVDGTHFAGDWRARILGWLRPGSVVPPATATAPPGANGANRSQSPQWPTEADVVAFKALGVSLRIGSPSLSEDLWLVPAYTQEDRLEMTADDAIAVCKIVQAFPGSKVADVVRDKTNQRKEATRC